MIDDDNDWLMMFVMIIVIEDANDWLMMFVIVDDDW